MSFPCLFQRPKWLWCQQRYSTLLYHFLIHGIALQVFSVSQNMQPITVRIKYAEYVLVRQLVQVRVALEKKRQPSWTHREKLPKHGADEWVFCCSHFSSFFHMYSSLTKLIHFGFSVYSTRISTTLPPSTSCWPGGYNLITFSKSLVQMQSTWHLANVYYMAQYVEAQEFSQTLHFLEPHKSHINLIIIVTHILSHTRVCLKIGYIPNYSHLIGIMIINHWV